MEKRKRFLGYYDYTVILTYLGMLCSFHAILMAINERYWDSVIFLMLAGFFDMLDGTVANTKNRDRDEKRFGIQIDSLCDLVGFGIMPGIFVYMISGKSPYVGIISALYALAALIRLSYFNVCEEKRQDRTDEKRTHFTGLPVTSIAVLLPVVFLLQEKTIFKSVLPYVLLLVLCGTGFLSPVEIKKPDIKGKVILCVFGLMEVLGLLFLGWDLV
ncbi:MAG: CDP-alcohol phosphatidyltransferase family protein [Lachnospiraceae bacterium]|nr:CDP-alcohol phosphatidyltransferase family protein [Lachnospiraceae bacterium]